MLEINTVAIVALLVGIYALYRYGVHLDKKRQDKTA
jgi:hypothetical protein